jgi:hypothetical protein
MKIMKAMKVKKLRLQAIGFRGSRDSGTTLCASVSICGETDFSPNCLVEISPEARRWAGWFRFKRLDLESQRQSRYGWMDGGPRAVGSKAALTMIESHRNLMT